MPCDPVKNPCPISCPKVREQLRIAIKELPNVTDGIFPQKKNDIEPRLPSDVISRDIQDERVIETVYVDEEFPIIQEPTFIPTEEIVDHDEEKIDFVEEKKLVEEPAVVSKETVIPTEKIVERDEEKLDLITKEKLEPVTEKEIVIPPESITVRDDKKIDFVEEKEPVVEGIAAEPVQEVSIEEVAIEEPEIEDKIKLVPITKIELEPSRELEERFEQEEVEYEEEESITSYEKFIDEELRESLPAVIAREIPEESRVVRREISRNAATLYERIDRERHVRPPREREAVTAMPEERPVEEGVPVRRALENSTITEQIPCKPVEDACEETCPLVKEQKERIMRKLKVRQRVVDHYYLTKGFNYFEDVCTCSLACMVYTLSRDPFVKSIFASLALFAVGLKLCSELDAWEMPSRIS